MFKCTYGASHFGWLKASDRCSFSTFTPTARSDSTFDSAKCSSFWATRSESICYSKMAHSCAYHSKDLSNSHPASMHQISVLLGPRENLNEDHEVHLGTTNPLLICSQYRYRQLSQTRYGRRLFQFQDFRISVYSKLFIGNRNFFIMPPYKLFTSIITWRLRLLWCWNLVNICCSQPPAAYLISSLRYHESILLPYPIVHSLLGVSKAFYITLAKHHQRYWKRHSTDSNQVRMFRNRA